MKKYLWLFSQNLFYNNDGFCRSIFRKNLSAQRLCFLPHCRISRHFFNGRCQFIGRQLFHGDGMGANSQRLQASPPKGLIHHQRISVFLRWAGLTGQKRLDINIDQRKIQAASFDETAKIGVSGNPNSVPLSL